MAVDAAIGFLMAPFLIHRLGDTTYGLWILIGSLTGYVGMLDFGLRGSVGRYVALYHSRGDRAGLLSTVNTAAVVLLLLGTAALAAVGLLTLALPLLVEVPVDQLFTARLALAIVGLHLTCFFVLRIFDGMLWGVQRFDLLNAVDIPAAILRGVLMATAVTRGHGLVGLALVTLGITLTGGIAKACMCFWQISYLKVTPRHFQMDQVRQLSGYGIWNFLISIASMARNQLGPIILGSVMGLAAVTPFSIVMRLVNYAGMALTAATGVLTPLATQLHARGEMDRQRRLFLESGKLCAAAACLFFLLFAFLGEPLLVLWVGPRFSNAWLALVVLAAGEVVPSAAAMAQNTVIGMAEHRPIAWRGFAEAAVGLGLGAVLSIPWGLVGFCLGQAISATWFRGVFMLLYTCRLLDIPVTAYLRSSVLPIVAASVCPAVLLAFAKSWQTPATWPILLLYGFVFVFGYGAFAGAAAFGLAHVRRLAR